MIMYHAYGFILLNIVSNNTSCNDVYKGDMKYMRFKHYIIDNMSYSWELEEKKGTLPCSGEILEEKRRNLKCRAIFLLTSSLSCGWVRVRNSRASTTSSSSRLCLLLFVSHRSVGKISLSPSLFFFFFFFFDEGGRLFIWRLPCPFSN